MNIQQLEYIIAVAQHKHFGKAATACFVTQPTLSAMIQKLEDELDIQIFDRSAKPVLPTECGKEIIEQAKIIIAETNLLKEKAAASKGNIQGELVVGVIPTVAVYLMPILVELLTMYPKLKLIVRELSTENIIDKLHKGEIDSGILATPLRINDLHEDALYVEPLRVFVAEAERKKKQYILPTDIDPSRVWMLEEGHCLSKQFVNYCNLKGNAQNPLNFNFQTGSLETLLRLVEVNNGITIIPGLAAEQLDEKRKNQLRDFKAPVPIRLISLVSYRPSVKARLNTVLKDHIQQKVALLLDYNKLKKGKVKIVEIV